MLHLWRTRLSEVFVPAYPSLECEFGEERDRLGWDVVDEAKGRCRMNAVRGTRNESNTGDVFDGIIVKQVIGGYVSNRVRKA